MPVLKPLNFGTVRAPNNLMFAPLAGFSHSAMRICTRNFGAGYCVTEMVSIEGIMRDSRKTLQYADISDAPLLSSIQLFGEDPARFADAASRMKEEFGAASININFGCPAPKVQRGGGGSELLKTPAKMKAIIRAVKKTGLSVEAKIRAGFDSDSLETLMDAVEDADCIILHCRLVKDRFLAGTADWNRFARARALTEKCFIANGDIKTPEDALAVLNRYGADGVMIGRAAVAKPYIFRQIAELDRQGSYQSPSPVERLEMLEDFARLWVHVRQKDDLTPLRAALMSRVDTFDGAVRLRSALAQCSNIENLLNTLHSAKETLIKG